MRLFPFPITSLALVAVLCLTACEPQAPDLIKVNAIKAQNDQLSADIVEWEKIIKQAGEPQQGLQEELDALDVEIANAMRRKTALRKVETDLKLRRIELQKRLKTLRAAFEQMQNEIANNAI